MSRRSRSTLCGKYLCYAVLALSVDLLWGTGIVESGTSAFFSWEAMRWAYLLLMIGTRGQYRTHCPTSWCSSNSTNVSRNRRLAHAGSFQSSSGLAGAVVWVPAVVALIFGCLAFPHQGVYFSILTQALTYAACLMFFRNDFTFGGNNGLTDFKDVLGFTLNAHRAVRSLLLQACCCSEPTCSVGGSLRHGLAKSARHPRPSVGTACSSRLRDFQLQALRVCAVRYYRRHGRTLYVPQAGIINPSEMAPDKSLEAVVWVAVGGRGTLVGPIQGRWS